MAKTYTTKPKNHRSGVTAVDSADPADTTVAVDSRGYKECRLDTAITGNDFQSLETQILFWNSRQQKWFGGSKYTFTETGQHALVVDCRGAIIFLKVTAFSGISFSLSADYTLN